MAVTPFEGIARKVVLPMIALSAVGWLVYVVGFGFFNNRQSQHHPGCKAPENYPFYAAAVIAPLVYIGAVGHAAHWRQSIVGSIIAVLSVVCFTAMGYILHFTGIGIYNYNQQLEQFCTFDRSYTIMFSGSFIACLFCTGAGVLAMWPWYTTAAPTYGRLQQSAMISMDETMERGTYEPTNPPQ